MSNYVKCKVCGHFVKQAKTGTLQRHKALPRWRGSKQLRKDPPGPWCPGGGIPKDRETRTTSDERRTMLGNHGYSKALIDYVEAFEPRQADIWAKLLLEIKNGRIVIQLNDSYSKIIQKGY